MTTKDTNPEELEQLMMAGKMLMQDAFDQGIFHTLPATDRKVMSASGETFRNCVYDLCDTHIEFFHVLEASRDSLSDDKFHNYGVFGQDFLDQLHPQLIRRAQAVSRRARRRHFLYALRRCKNLRELLFGDWPALDIIDRDSGETGR